MADKKEKKEFKKMVTPIGIAKYPWLNEPKTKFKEDGEYTLQLIVPEEDAQNLIEVINGVVDEAYNEKYNELKDKDRKKLIKHYPYANEEVEDGETPTGNIEFKMRTDATFKDKSGQIKERKLTLVDKKGKPVDGEKQLIFGGSKVRANVTVAPFYMPSTKTVGATLYLNAVQVIEFAERDSLESLGFSVIEDEEDPGIPDEQVPAGGSSDPEDF